MTPTKHPQPLPGKPRPRKRVPDPLLRQLRLRAALLYPRRRTLSFTPLFHQKEQPETFCPLTAAVLSSLALSTTQGRASLSSLLHAAYLQRPVRRPQLLSKAWHTVCREDPTTTAFSAGTDNWRPSRHALAQLRAKSKTLQADIQRLLTLSLPLQQSQLQYYLLDLSNLWLWFETTAIIRLYQLRRLLDELNEQPATLQAKIHIQSQPADYVTRWATARHAAGITTASTATLQPLATMPSFVPQTLIRDLTEGRYPQRPWQFWRTRSTIAPLLVTPLSSPASIQLPTPVATPQPPPYSPTPTHWAPPTPQRSPTPDFDPNDHRLFWQQDQSTNPEAPHLDAEASPSFGHNWGDYDRSPTVTTTVADPRYHLPSFPHHLREQFPLTTQVLPSLHHLHGLHLSQDHLTMISRISTLLASTSSMTTPSTT